MSNKNNLMGHNRGKGHMIDKKDLLKMLDILSKDIKPGMTGYTQDIIKIIKSKEEKTLIVNSISFSGSNLKDDIELLNLLLKLLNNYSKSVNDLKSKIDEELPDIISSNSSNLNIKLALSLINIGVFFGYNLSTMYSYLLTRYYIKSDDVSSDIYKSVPGSLSTVASMVQDLNKMDFSKLIEMIGKFPTIRNMSSNKNDLPSHVVLGFMKSELGVSAKNIVSYITKSFNLFKRDRLHSKQTNRQLKNIVGPVGFLGNPIYHIRLFLVDLQVNSYEKVKNNKRILELKIAKLKSDVNYADNENKSKLDEQIDYYTNRVEKLDLILTNIMDDVDHRVKNR